MPRMITSGRMPPPRGDCRSQPRNAWDDAAAGSIIGSGCRGAAAATGGRRPTRVIPARLAGLHIEGRAMGSTSASCIVASRRPGCSSSGRNEVATDAPGGAARPQVAAPSGPRPPVGSRTRPRPLISGFSCRLVLVDQSAEDRLTSGPGRGQALRQAIPGAADVPAALDAAAVCCSALSTRRALYGGVAHRDQHPVGQFGSHRQYEAFGEPVARLTPNGKSACQSGVSTNRSNVAGSTKLCLRAGRLPVMASRMGDAGTETWHCCPRQHARSRSALMTWGCGHQCVPASGRWAAQASRTCAGPVRSGERRRLWPSESDRPRAMPTMDAQAGARQRCRGRCPSGGPAARRRPTSRRRRADGRHRR